MRSKDENGFALIEVLVAGLLLTLVLFGISAMLTMSYGHLGRSGEQTSAVVLGQQRVEWLRNQDYSASVMSQGVTSEALSGEYQGYTRVSRIDDDTPRVGMKSITVVTTTPGGISTRIVALRAEP